MRKLSDEEVLKRIGRLSGVVRLREPLRNDKPECNLCECAFHGKQTVWKVHLTPHGRSWLFQYCCYACRRSLTAGRQIRFDEPKPCEHCERPVRVQRRYGGKRIFCCDSHSRLIYPYAAAARRKQKRIDSLKRHKYVGCGKSFLPKRIDQKYHNLRANSGIIGDAMRVTVLVRGKCYRG